MLRCMFPVFQCCFVLYVLCVYCAHFYSLHERPSCQNGKLFTPPVSFSLRVGPDFKWVLPVADILMLWCMYVVLMRKKAAPHNNRIHFVLFVCVLCTMWCFVWFLHEMVLLQHENLNYCTKHIWCLCKLQNKNFSMVCCTTLWWDGAGKGRGWKTAAIIYCWQQQHVRGWTAHLSDISSGATCVADLDSAALALTKEASGNSRERDQRQKRHGNEQCRVWCEEFGGWEYQKQSESVGGCVKQKTWRIIWKSHIISLGTHITKRWKQGCYNDWYQALSLTVETKVFGEGLGNKKLKAPFDEEAYHLCICFQITSGKSLVGTVKQDEQIPGLQKEHNTICLSRLCGQHSKRFKQLQRRWALYIYIGHRTPHLFAIWII